MTANSHDPFRTTKCSYCEITVDLPFTCSYCGRSFCVGHRLPESHNCPELIFGRRLPHVTIIRHETGVADARRRSPEVKLSKATSSEVRALLIAWVVLSFCFSIGSLFSPWKFVKIFSISSATLGLGFIGHELMHRTFARKYGCWAEFRLWRTGLVMALLFAFISGGRMIFAAPGAVYISSSNIFGYGISKRVYGIVSLSGPLTNMLVALFFFVLTGAGGILSEVGQLGYSVNMWLAAFNLLPLGIMDGQKVFRWNTKIWAAAAIPAWILAFLPVMQSINVKP